MSLSMSVTRPRAVRPNEALFSGYGLSALGTVVPAGYTGVGAGVLMSGATIVEKYGLPTKLGIPSDPDEQLYFHFRALRDNTTGACSGTGWLSVGPVCDNTLDPSMATPAIDYILDENFYSIQVKKRTGGTIGNFLLDRAATPLGNYIKIFEDAIAPEQFSEFLGEVKTYYGPLFSENKILTTRIGAIREADVYLRPQVDDNLTIEWEEAYVADANEETLWLQDDAGNLLTEIRIYEDQLEGAVNFPLEAGKTYKLVVPGYSFRNYSLVFEQTMHYVIEPVKVHFMGTLGENSTFFFKVNAGEEATFCMKDYNQGAIESPYGAILTRVSDDFVIDLDTEVKQWFYQHDSVAIPVAVTDEYWKVELKGKGRSAFWLDGIPNLFGDGVSTYFRPAILNNSVKVDMPSYVPVTSIGKVPRLGHYMPYVNIPAGDITDTLLSLNADTANIYTFFQPMTVNPNFEDQMREDMLTTFGMTRDYTIFDAGVREALFDYSTDPECATGLSAWIDNMYRLRTHPGEHYISAVDEPNLGQPTYEWYRDHFIAFAEAVRANPKSVDANIKIAAPATSRFDHGTTMSDSKDRKGELWLSQLVDERPDLIDAVVWHEWLVHGLLNLRQYANTIERAYKYTNGGERRLCIEQTNTSGGSSVSLYHQNTQFCTLWWAGIFAVACQTGKLDDLIYFLLFDEESHPKGLLFSNEDFTVFTKKLVGEFQGWLGGYLKGTTDGKAYRIDNPKIETELCAWTNVLGGVTRKFQLGVNKSGRDYVVELEQFDWGTSGVKLEFFNPDGTVSVESPVINTGAETCTFTLPAETVYLLSHGVV